MLEVDFYNDSKRLLGSMFWGVEIPEGVSEIKISGNHINDTSSGFKQLLILLKRSVAKVEKVNICDIQQVSPEYLAFLVWLAPRTHTLVLQRCMLGDSGFGCMMSGILVPNGIKRLDLFLGGDNSPRITRHQAALLCEAVASSSSLEQLWIQASFENLDEMGRSFVRTLGQNRSLKAVHLLTSPFNDRAIVPNLLKAAVLQTKVKDLRIGLYGGPLNELPMDVLVDVVCRSDCSLCRLSLVGILIDPVDYTGAKVTEKNSSVEELELISFGRARFEDIMRVLLLFNSLKRLDLSQNSISSDLAPLDTLLMTADRSAMEKLTLNENDITEDNFKIFLNKLPWMHSLKSLEVGRNPALNSESCLNALKDAVWLNKSLEHVYYENDAEDAEETIPNLQHIDSMIRLATSLNRGAKRKILNEYPLSLPQNLWAHVLKRAMTIKYYDFNFNDNTPTLTSPRLDVVFWLLREKMLC